MATIYIGEFVPPTEVEATATFNPENGLVEIWVDDLEDKFSYLANLRLTPYEATQLSLALDIARQEASA